MKAEYNDEYGVLVTEDGRIFREIAQWTDKHGYNAVTLKTTDCKHKNMFVHRLVAMGFCDKGSHIIDVCRGTRNKVYGYHFEFVKGGD